MASTLAEPLAGRAKHLFAFTSAGKPVFSRYTDGEEVQLAPLYALLLVLMERTASTGGIERLETRAPPGLFGSDDAGPPFPRVTFHFHRQDGMCYVMATRARAVGAANPREGLHRAEEQRRRRDSAEQWELLAAVDAGIVHDTGAPPPPPPPPPPLLTDDASCRRQLRGCHLLLLSVVPTLAEVLARDPGCDVRQFLAPADTDIIRAFLDAGERSASLAAAAVSVAPAEWGRGVGGGPLTHPLPAVAALAARGVRLPALMRYFDFLLRKNCSTVTAAGGGGEENLIFACLAVAATSPAMATEGPLRLLACVDRSRQLFGAPVGSGDVVVLTEFCRAVLRRQRGEAWAPLALAGFTTTGFLWCHCTAVGGDGDLALLQVSVSGDDFTALSGAAQRIAAALGAVEIGQFVDKAALPRGEGGAEGCRAPLLSLFGVPTGGRGSPTATGARPPPFTPEPAPAPPLLGLFPEREARWRQRRRALHDSSRGALDTLLYYQAVYAPAAGGEGEGEGGDRSGVPSLRHFRRSVEGVRVESAAYPSLLAAARWPCGGGSSSATSPFTVMESVAPLAAGDGGLLVRRRCRVLLLRHTHCAPLLAQLCQFYYRNADALRPAERQQLLQPDGPAKVLAAARPYTFSRLLRAAEQSGMEELAVVVDAEAASEEVGWYCLMAVLHSHLL